MLSRLINEFIAEKRLDATFELYNEFGLQHELAFYLRKRFEENYPNYKLKLEYNIGKITEINNRILNGESFLKKEMDIYVYNDETNYKACIEIKFPSNGAVPTRMYQSLVDIKFLEQLRLNGFNEVLFLFISSDSNYWQGKDDGIYSLFRTEHQLRQIDPPRFIRNRNLNIQGVYGLGWENFNGDYRFFKITV